jgi:transposase
MMAEVEIRNERVDDIPLLVAQQRKMGIAEIIDENLEPHWHRQGLSIGQTVIAWLAFILSESDHRLSYAEPWVTRHLETLRQVITAELTAQEFNDDRLGAVLRYLSDDASWPAIERELGKRLIRVYRLPLTPTWRLIFVQIRHSHSFTIERQVTWKLCENFT